jgi:hypothetical protein
MLDSKRGFSGSLTTQQKSFPWLVAQAWNSPVTTRLQPVDRPTCRGVRTSVDAGKPSGPYALPQHHSVPLVLVAHVEVRPADTSAQSPVPTLTGTSRWDLVPSPNSPDMLEPQHHKVRFLRIAQAWVSPTDTDVQPSDLPTRCGTFADFTDPRPRRLRVTLLAPPQHHSPPFLVIAQVRLAPHCDPATETAIHAREWPTRVGDFADLVVPLPNWPYWLLPQHHSEPSVRMAHAWPAPTSRRSQVAAVPTRRGVPWALTASVSAAPQHHRVLSALIPHVRLPPAATCCHPAVCAGRAGDDAGIGRGDDSAHPTRVTARSPTTAVASWAPRNPCNVRR